MKIYQIDWIDSCGNDAWMQIADAKSPPVHCKSIGYLLHECDEYVTITRSIGVGPDGQPEQSEGILTVPQCAIVNMWEVTIQ